MLPRLCVLGVPAVTCRQRPNCRTGGARLIRAEGHRPRPTIDVVDELQITGRDSPAGGAERAANRGSVTRATRSHGRISVPSIDSRPGPTGVTAAWTAFIVGTLYAAVSVYWGLGGTWLLDTVGGSLAQHRHSAGVMIAVWVAAALKLIAAVLPLQALRHRGGPRRVRSLWVLSWVAAAILIAYGFVLTVVGLLVQTGVVRASSTADHRALAWHAYLWDPWFLVWGVLIAVALLQAGRSRHAEQMRR